MSGPFDVPLPELARAQAEQITALIAEAAMHPDPVVSVGTLDMLQFAQRLIQAAADAVELTDGQG